MLAVPKSCKITRKPPSPNTHQPAATAVASARMTTNRPRFLNRGQRFSSSMAIAISPVIWRVIRVMAASWDE
jgi:hypothetical protein